MAERLARITGPGVRSAGWRDGFFAAPEEPPGWMRELGLEWVYRFSREPGRMWKCYWIGNFVFVARVMRERLRGRHVPLPRKPEEREA
jgi:UDP-N-acetyl-D-mannosaminuronic acid transferase (WecB/TagA/CpsF family)